MVYSEKHVLFPYDWWELINHAVGNGPTSIRPDKSMRIIKHFPDTCAMMIIYIEVESYVTETGKVIKETAKQYHIIRFMSLRDHIESY